MNMEHAHDKWVKEMLSSEIMNQKYRAAAMRAHDEYIDHATAREELTKIFEWLRDERCWFPNNTMQYFLDITISILDTFYV